MRAEAIVVAFGAVIMHDGAMQIGQMVAVVAGRFGRSAVLLLDGRPLFTICLRVA